MSQYATALDDAIRHEAQAVPPTLDGINRWANANQPTRWDDLFIPLSPLPKMEADPMAPLWFRMRYMYAPTYITDPRTILKGLTIT